MLGNNWPPSYGWGQKTSALIALNCRLDCLLCPKKVKRKVAPCFKNFGAIWKKCKWSMRATSHRSLMWGESCFIECKNDKPAHFLARITVDLQECKRE